MTAVLLLAIGVVFSVGAVTGIVIMVSLASRKEDRRARLSREAPGGMTNAARFLTGLYVRRPGDEPWRDYSGDDHADYSEYQGPRPGPWS
jgi:hypothetical protein